jgi:hypothetical protein
MDEAPTEERRRVKTLIMMAEALVAARRSAGHE